MGSRCGRNAMPSFISEPLSKPLSVFSRLTKPARISPIRSKVWMQELKKRSKTITLEELASKSRDQQAYQIQASNKEHNSQTPLWSLWTNPTTLHRWTAFVPGSVGFQCFQLAQEAVERLEAGTAQTSYVHRGSKRGEKWVLNGCKWIMDVDCAGFVRNVFQTVTGSAIVEALSDRDYMRAKDFYTFFEHLEHTVTDEHRPAIAGSNQLQWCRVDDLRTVLAGDIIVYRAKGGAAGGSVFTKKDCLKQALTAVKTAELYDVKDEETGDQHVDINVSKLPEVTKWVKEVMEILKSVGIESIDQIRGDNCGDNDEDNDDNLQSAISVLEQEEKLSENTVSLLQEVLSSTNGNTGHIMFAAGSAEETSQDTHIWRVPVYHSTGVVPKRKRGAQRSYK